jgi:hypothetical protein
MAKINALKNMNKPAANAIFVRNEDEPPLACLPDREQDRRSLSEIGDAIGLFASQFWYNEHKALEWKIEQGEHKLVTQSEWDANVQPDYGRTHTIDTVWKNVLMDLKKIERKLGEGNYGPWADCEVGLIAGKLSALRWILGHEWDDFLDT